MKNDKGFSLLEMVLVLILIALLTVSAAPLISDLMDEAKITQVEYVIQQVHSGLSIYWANQALINDGLGAYPGSLESGSCCFAVVLQDPVTSGWSISGGVYTADISGETFTYDSSQGCLIISDEGDECFASATGGD